MERMRAHESQSPQIDVNGNGIANELLDLRALGERLISTDISSLSLPLPWAANSSGHIRGRGKES